MRLRFVSIFISDEDKAVDFYVGKLGFTLVVDNPMPGLGRFLMFAPPGGGANLVATKPVPGVPGAQVGGSGVIAWETDDVQAVYQQLRDQGVEFTQEPKRAFWGGLEARFKDPDGNSFLLQQGEMAKPVRS